MKYVPYLDDLSLHCEGSDQDYADAEQKIIKPAAHMLTLTYSALHFLLCEDFLNQTILKPSLKQSFEVVRTVFPKHFNRFNTSQNSSSSLI